MGLLVQTGIEPPRYGRPRSRRRRDKVLSLQVVASALLAIVLGCQSPSPSPTTPPAPDGASTPAASTATSPTTAAMPTLSGFGEARSRKLAQALDSDVAPGAFPRRVRDASGEVVIPARPTRIHTLSLGYDEITFRLVDRSRIVAVGTSTANPDFSNVAEEAAQISTRVGRNAEQIVALNPDLVVGSPFSNPDLLQRLRDASVPLVVVDLVSSADAHADNIRLLAYLYGEEERGEALVREVQERVGKLRAATSQRPRDQWPSVLVLEGGQALYTPGKGTTEDGILALAGARNAAAEAGIVGNVEITAEKLPDLDPDYLIVAEPSPSKPSIMPLLGDSPVAPLLQAVRNNRVIQVRAPQITTLSHWNLEGAERIHRALYGGAQP